MTRAGDDWRLAPEPWELVDEVDGNRRLKELIIDLPIDLPIKLPDEEPPAGWQERVLASIAALPPVAAERPRRARRRWGPYAALAGAALAAALAVLIVRSRDPGSPPLQADTAVTVVVRRGSAVQRTTQAAVGAELEVSVRGAREPHEVRVYRDDRVLVATCRDSAPCTVVAGAPGAYRAVLVHGAQLPPATGRFDADIEAARVAGALVAAAAVIDVR